MDLIHSLQYVLPYLYVLARDGVVSMEPSKRVQQYFELDTPCGLWCLLRLIELCCFAAVHHLDIWLILGGLVLDAATHNFGRDTICLKTLIWKR